MSFDILNEAKEDGAEEIYVYYPVKRKSETKFNILTVHLNLTYM